MLKDIEIQILSMRNSLYHTHYFYRYIYAYISRYFYIGKSTVCVWEISQDTFTCLHAQSRILRHVPLSCKCFSPKYFLSLSQLHTCPTIDNPSL